MHVIFRWRLVVHAGIDGYSRLIVYCRCSTDNYAATVLKLFMGATETYGLPSRVRWGGGIEEEKILMLATIC